MRLDDVFVASGDRLAGGSPEVDALFDAGAVAVTAEAVGAAEAALALTVGYARDRLQFGRPIGQFQGVKHQLAGLASRCEPMRGLFWHAAYAFDHVPAERTREAAIAKAHVTDTAVDTARLAVELHGGIGFTWECDVQFWLKRAMFDRTWLGTPRAHRERIARLAGW